MMLPGAAMAQDKATACALMLEAARIMEAKTTSATDSAAAFYNDMLDMQERIGGQDGAALAVKAEEHLTDVARAMLDAAQAAQDAREAVLAYCAP